ncbi:MAG TPA: MFS transporter [Candidatus Sulfotelmatobacter sp.]|nr:MFS transporter [Candidatus Sulfotelmatobacter sp.]
MATIAIPQKQAGTQTRAFVVAWAFTVVFYFLEYAIRSSPAVMISELEASFGTTALGVSAILGIYYYTYSSMSLVAGAALDHFGAKRSIPVGVAILGVGCLLFSLPSVLDGNIGRLLQGAGSAFAFTGAVYLAAHGFSARYLATAIGATQCVGMLGGSAGQFVAGPMIEHGVNVHVFWIGIGIVVLINAVLVFLAAPKQQLGEHMQAGGIGALLKPYEIVFKNPQSYLCGIVAGLMFAPTTIGDMIWGVASFQKDLQFTYHQAVIVASMVPLGWVFGCPLLGWLSDRIGKRKPVIIGSAAFMILAAAQIAFKPLPISTKAAMFLFGVASGAAMIPYSVIKEVNPDSVKGSATGGINFLVFALTAFLGPVYADRIGKSTGLVSDLHAHFQKGAIFWIACCAVAILVSFFLRETGPAAQAPAGSK